MTDAEEIPPFFQSRSVSVKRCSTSDIAEEADGSFSSSNKLVVCDVVIDEEASGVK